MLPCLIPSQLNGEAGRPLVRLRNDAERRQKTWAPHPCLAGGDRDRIYRLSLLLEFIDGRVHRSQRTRQDPDACIDRYFYRHKY